MKNRHPVIAAAVAALDGQDMIRFLSTVPTMLPSFARKKTFCTSTITHRPPSPPWMSRRYPKSCRRETSANAVKPSTRICSTKIQLWPAAGFMFLKLLAQA
ncbi:hypothetical protein EXIGLDRAFT_437395 [Exidia glandulosa HHB12029]|uniref:Uncharacterized protein n=1 Tax=Exidia glandulosa HHB12029 TaxID=1314781 RepID=A0A165B816_EXIGL|nr:hypothetical protein EXIGLDRAFT_437395 [Exidia glandulosa HHB12029]